MTPCMHCNRWGCKSSLSWNLDIIYDLTVLQISSMTSQSCILITCTWHKVQCNHLFLDWAVGVPKFLKWQARYSGLASSLEIVAAFQDTSSKCILVQGPKADIRSSQLLCLIQCLWQSKLPNLHSLRLNSYMNSVCILGIVRPFFHWSDKSVQTSNYSNNKRSPLMRSR